jgi:hypothetical protein
MYLSFNANLTKRRGHHGLRLLIQSVPIPTKVVSCNPTHGEVYSIQHYVIKFVSVTCGRTVVSSTNKTDRHDITEILLKVPLITITLTHQKPSLLSGKIFGCPYLVKYCLLNTLLVKIHR